MTSLSAALQWLAAMAFELLGIATVIDGFRHPENRVRVFLGLAVSLLGGAALINCAETRFGYREDLGDLTIVLFLASGYAFLRFRDSLIPLPLWIRRGGLGLNLAAATAAVMARLPAGADPAHTPGQNAAVVLLVVVWSLCTGEPVVRMALISLRLPAVQASRLRALATAYAGIALILLVSEAAGARSRNPGFQVATRLMALLIVPFLCAAIAPPGWLRRIWRGSEEEAFRKATVDLLLFSPDLPTLAERALGWAIRLVGADAGFIVSSKGEVLAADGIAGSRARQIVDRVRADRHAGHSLVTVEADGGPRTAQVIPLQSRFGGGFLATVSGPFTPVFGSDEVGRLVQYAAALTGAVDRVQLTGLIRLLQDVATTANQTSSIEVAGAWALARTCAYTGWQLGHAYLAPTGIGSEANPTHVWYPADGRLFTGFRQASEASAGIPEAIIRTVLSEARPISHPALNATPAFARAKEAGVAGIVGGYWFPIMVGTEAVGVLEFFSTDTATPDDSVLQALASVGTTLGSVVERNRSNRRVQVARVAAEVASQAKSDYLSRMSHEFRTPLNAILGFAQLLELQPRDEDRECIQAILKAGTHLLRLVDDLLDIARIESGKETLSVEPVHIAAVVDECLALIRPLAAKHQMTLRRDLAASGAEYVQADRQRLIQILLNLLSNGVKYGGEGSSVVITGHAVARDRVRLDVTDDGPGIPASQVGKLYEPFARLGAERTSVPGTGLGLSLVKLLGESMGGAIGVDTAVGEGSTFWLELARAPAPAGDESLVGRGIASSAPAASPPQPPRRTVLYVEDNLATIDLMERVFALRPQIKLVTAMQGGLAHDLAREHHPDLIVLDLHLPDIQGDELLLRFKHDPLTRATPVVMLSADATQRQVDRLLLAGAQRYLTKPVNVSEFLALLDGVLAQPPE